MFLRRFPFFCVLLAFLLFSGICKANKTHICHPSSCGSIRNISHPFRLNTDPLNCGNRRFQLTCESNQAVLHLHSGKFYVKEINYHNLSIQVVDAGIQKDNCFSRPLYSLPLSSLLIEARRYVPYYVHPYGNDGGDELYHYLPVSGEYDGYATYYYGYATYNYMHRYNGEAIAYVFPYYMRHHDVVTFINCPVPLKKTVFVDTAPCNTSRGSYVVYGAFTASDMEESCSIGARTLVSTHGAQINTRSFLSIYRSMANGFQLLWVDPGDCNESGWGDSCSRDVASIVEPTNHCTGPKIPFFHSHCLSELWQIILDALQFVRDKLHIIEAHIAVRVLCGIPCILFLVCKFRRRHLSMYENIEEFLQSQNNLTPIRYSYSQVWMMTKGFKNKLGEGGYGSVYKGSLRSGDNVAVKKLDKAKGNGQDFINEVATIGRIHHVNVVRLVGFCVENSHRAIVYDFMPNGSLEKHIFSQEGEISITYDKMYEISLGVARGIEYLHRGCDMQILHFDIKPHNILLDENFIPKISDFGLAKLYQANDSIVSLTAARGTMGYMAPELFYKNIGGVSHKADVYSYGMLLMEMASRRKNLNAFEERLSEIHFPSWVYEQFQKGKEMDMGDVTEEERKIVKKMIIVALWCIQMKPEDRPKMHKVVEMLEGTMEALQMPPKPFLTPQELARGP